MAYPGDVYAADCSARDALALISGKWVMLLLPALAQGPQRNGALLRKIEGISQKVLTQTLRQLERNGLVERCERGSKPLHVEYRLTEVARGLVDTLSALDRWAEHNFPALDAAREAERIYRVRYESGAESLQSWITAQQTRRNAEITLAENRLNQLLNHISLAQALGGGAEQPADAETLLSDSRVASER